VSGYSKKTSLRRQERMNLNCPKGIQTLKCPSLRPSYHHFVLPEIEIVLVFDGLADFAVFHHFFDPLWLGILFLRMMIYGNHALLQLLV
jgi:hypothetical protein